MEIKLLVYQVWLALCISLEVWESGRIIPRPLQISLAVIIRKLGLSWRDQKACRHAILNYILLFSILMKCHYFKEKWHIIALLANNNWCATKLFCICTISVHLKTEKIQIFFYQLIFISTSEKEASYDIVKRQIERDVTNAAAELSKRDLFLS